MRGSYGIILVFLFFGAGLVFLSILIARFVQPRNMNPEKLATYECGEEPVGEPVLLQKHWLYIPYAHV